MTSLPNTLLWHGVVCPTGMNSALVLIILLLAVPLQLFLTHYINTTYPASTNANSATEGSVSKDSAGKDVDGSIDTVRVEAFHR